MDEHPVTTADFLIGLQGLAVLRRWGGRWDVTSRRDEVGELLAVARDPDQRQIVFEERDVVTGYSTIAATYDDNATNMVIHAEQPIVQGLLAGQPAGRALDAACGTGRHAAFLVERGHEVIGVDQTPAMLDRARATVPAARFETGTLEALPLEDATVDLVVCALALTHVEQLTPAVVELARVVKPGGRVVVSDVHPVSCLLGLQTFETGGGQFVRNRVRTHSQYLAAFRAAGLEVRDCVEPAWTDDLIVTQPWTRPIESAARDALQGLPLVLIWDLART